MQMKSLAADHTALRIERILYRELYRKRDWTNVIHEVTHKLQKRSRDMNKREN